MKSSLQFSDRYREIDRLFAAALDLPVERRGAFLRAACTEDDELWQRVERLLVAEERSLGFLEEPAGLLRPLAEEGDASEFSGQLFGAYRLLHRIGRGGMGDVYLARRDDGQFDRRVAVKVLHSGLLGTEAQERFEAERKTLARLEHPGIARLYDGGTTPDGCPFLVMEQVDGLPIDEYAERHALSLVARLDLMLLVCSAVDFAHRNLVAHGDLKPENILVDGRGEPKLLDFGIAEPLAEEPTWPRPCGLLHAHWLTPSYASPEQVRGEPVTAASDVYALGVVLYELLTGRSPYPDSTTWVEVEHAIRSEIPMRPSESVVGSRRAGELVVGPRACDGASAWVWNWRPWDDLDAIVLKSLERNPLLRYATAAELAADLKAFLRGRPVHARNGA